ncbi:MAG: protease modulator HflC, partial [Methylobacter sp.]|nr:protease modulator HflC [Methylobacter sp.]
MSRTSILLPASFSLLMLAYLSIFYVNEHEKAILFRLGEMVDSDYRPGLHFKTPIINKVSTFDARVLTLDAKSERFLT